MKKSKLDIIILNYNTKELLNNCLLSLMKVKDETLFRIIVVDNGSDDGSVDILKKYNNNIVVVENNENLGFAKGNNRAKNICNAEFVLFLNSDTIVQKNTLRECIDFLKQNPTVGALTCKVILPDGNLDKDTRRSFITPWIGLTHIFLKLDKYFPKSHLFAKYWYGYIPDNVLHEVDAIQGAFFMTRKYILDKVGWFDEDYFLDGEDIDLSWKIKELGFQNMYYPKVSITHIKGATKGKNINRFRKGKVSLKDKLRYKMAGVNSMELFYRKRLWNKYPYVLNMSVIFGIKLLKVLRFLKVVIIG